MEQAVRLFILLLVFVFDPLAVMLIIAANQTLLRYGINLESSGPEIPKGSKREAILKGPDNPSAVEDAAKVMAESASQKKSLENEINKLRLELSKKPKEVEKIVEVEKIIEVEKEIDMQIKVPKAIKDLEKRLEKKLNEKE